MNDSPAETARETPGLTEIEALKETPQEGAAETLQETPAETAKETAAQRELTADILGPQTHLTIDSEAETEEGLLPAKMIALSPALDFLRADSAFPT
jgi:hypothetical protein